MKQVQLLKISIQHFGLRLSKHVDNIDCPRIVNQILGDLWYKLHLLRLVIQQFSLRGLPRNVFELTADDGVPDADDERLDVSVQAVREHRYPRPQHDEVHRSRITLHGEAAFVINGHESR